MFTNIYTEIYRHMNKIYRCVQMRRIELFCFVLQNILVILIKTISGRIYTKCSSTMRTTINRLMLIFLGAAESASFSIADNWKMWIVAALYIKWYSSSWWSVFFPSWVFWRWRLFISCSFCHQRGGDRW